ncbi:MAG: hypothetical protein WBE68_22265 [Candidatus Nitrosopolaris sp.]
MRIINKLFSNILIPTVGVCYDNAVVGFRVKEQREEKVTHTLGRGSEPYLKDGAQNLL